MNKQFDVVIGNPPYNKDMYLGFCENAFSLLKPDGVMVQITPAKFYGKGTTANKHFRDVIMPHIDEVHLYKCCTDVFDIAEPDGIAYWRAIKDKTFDAKEIYNYNKNASLDDTMGGQAHTHTEQPVQFMPLKCLALIEKCKHIAGGHTFFEEGYNQLTGRGLYAKDIYQGEPTPYEYEVWSGVGNTLHRAGWASASHLRTTFNIEKYKVVIGQMMMGGKGLQLDKNNMTQGNASANIVPANAVAPHYTVLYFADTLLEAESAKSYINSQLVAFVAINSVVANGSDTLAQWRHVPALPEGYTFDHIYTNEEIFNIFRLTAEEKDLITSLIKPRSKEEQ